MLKKLNLSYKCQCNLHLQSPRLYYETSLASTLCTRLEESLEFISVSKKKMIFSFLSMQHKIQSIEQANFLIK